MTEKHLTNNFPDEKNFTQPPFIKMISMSNDGNCKFSAINIRQGNERKREPSFVLLIWRFSLHWDDEGRRAHSLWLCLEHEHENFELIIPL